MKKYILGLLLLTACGTAPAGQQGQSGDSGAQGESGQNGLPGATGASGTGLTIESTKYCSKLDNGTSSTLFLQYQIVTYSTQDKFIVCSVSGSRFQVTNTVVYKSSQVGAVTNICKVTYDDQNNNSGFWTFSTQSDGTTPTGQYLGHTNTFADNNCVITQ